MSDITKKEYTGLLNQGGTCYLNSLLQSLYTIPSFRAVVLQFKYNAEIHASREDCIPFQLQKLFAKLELRRVGAIDTKGLTKSFQWHKNEGLYQHDIQELARVLFDAIEQSTEEEGKESYIQQLFGGLSENCIKCLTCNYESIVCEKLLDLTLPVLNPFENIKNSSFEMALLNLIKPETLEENNKYQCDKCQAKVEKAEKFTRLRKLPKIFMVQLSRFDYDYTLDHRIKINNKMSFPLSFSSSDFTGEATYNQCRKIYKDEVILDASFIETLNRSNVESSAEHDFFLHSVVVHSGTAHSGHYYAYIYDHKQLKWFNFNDSRVKETNETEIEKVFGDNEKGSSSTAYILFYIHKDQKDIEFKFDIAQSPAELREEIELELEKMQKEELIRLEKEAKELEKLKYLNIKALYPPIHNQHKINKSLELPKTMKMAELKSFLKAEFGLESINDNNLRLREYNQIMGRMQEAYEDLNLNLEEAKLTKFTQLTLETKEDDQVFKSYNPSLINIKIVFWGEEIQANIETLTKKELTALNFPSFNLTICKEVSTISLKEEILKIASANNISLGNGIKELFRKFSHADSYSSVKQIEINSKNLTSSMILDNAEILVETDLSLFQSTFDLHFSIVKVRFNNPISLEKVISGNVYTKDYSMVHVIEISKYKKLIDLKKEIAKTLGLSIEDFIMKAYGHYGKFYQDLNDSLENFYTLPLSNDVYVEYGLQLGSDEFQVNVQQCELDVNQTKFKVFPYKFKKLGTVIINKNDSIKTVKNIIYAQFYLDEQSENVKDFNQMQFRELLVDRPSKIFSDEVLVKDAEIASNKSYIVYFNSISEQDQFKISQGDIQILIRVINPADWTITPPCDFFFKKSMLLCDLKKQLSQRFLIEEPNLAAVKVINGYNQYFDDFRRSKFELLSDKEDVTVDQFPFYLNLNGSLLM